MRLFSRVLAACVFAAMGSASLADIYVRAPAGTAPVSSIGFGAIDGLFAPVTSVNGLPVNCIVGCSGGGLGPSGITPLTGTVSTTTITNSSALVPALGRAIVITLSGTWVGTAQLYRSTDSGTTWLPLTVGGQPWGIYTTNANEQVAEETDADATYRLTVHLSSGSLTYRVSQ